MVFFGERMRQVAALAHETPHPLGVRRQRGAGSNMTQRGKAATPAIAPPDLVIKQDGQRSERAANIDGRRVDGVGRRHPRLMSNVCILFQKLSCACRVCHPLVCILCLQIVCHHDHHLVLELSSATLSCPCCIVSGYHVAVTTNHGTSAARGQGE